jgi:hypothetical protein
MLRLMLLLALSAASRKSGRIRAIKEKEKGEAVKPLLCFYSLSIYTYSSLQFKYQNPLAPS